MLTISHFQSGTGPGHDQSLARNKTEGRRRDIKINQLCFSFSLGPASLSVLSVSSQAIVNMVALEHKQTLVFSFAMRCAEHLQWIDICN